VCRFSCKKYPALRQYHSSSQLCEKHIEKVPALGESITEGSISSWTKNVGDAVGVDECVVIIETDKVSVEIKSQHQGVLTRQIGDGDVAVGDELFELDTDGKVSASTSAPVPVTAAPAAAAANAASTKANHHHRTPLIKFIGKRSLVAAVKHAAPAAAAPMVSASSVKPVKDGKGVDFLTMPGGAWFGRPLLSAAEIEAIESGGASVAC